MLESNDFEKREESGKLVLAPETRIAASLKRSVASLALIMDDLRSILSEIDEYVLALEELLAGKITPTEDIAELKRRLSKAKRTLTGIREDLHEIEAEKTKQLSSFTAGFAIAESPNSKEG